MFGPTSFTLPAEEFHPVGGLIDRDSLREHDLLLGGL